MGAVPNILAPNPVGINPRAFYGFEVRNHSGPARMVAPEVSGSSSPIRIGDPITMSSGLASRGSAESASIYGFAAMPGIRTEIAQIPTMPYDLGPVSGNNRVGVYAAGAGNEFIGQYAFGSTLTSSLILGTYDIEPAVVAPTPVLTTAGTAGATTRYYTAVPVTLVGEAVGPTGTALTTSNATNDTTNYNIITIPYVAGAVWFNIYRGSSNSNGTLIGTVVANPNSAGTTVFNDTGLASLGSGLTVATRNDCGWVVGSGTDEGILTIRELVEPVGTVSGPNTLARVVFVVTPADSTWV